MNPPSTSPGPAAPTASSRREQAEALLPSRRGPLTAVALAAALPFLSLCALVVGGWWPLLAFDAVLAERLYAWVRPRPDLAHGLEVWTEAFGTWSMRIVSLLTAAWLVLRRQFSTALWACAAVFTANLLGLVTKLGVARERPEFTDPILVGVGPSFPSGHSLMAFTGMGILLFAALPLLRGAWRGAAWAAAAVIALSTALSRPMLGVHWFTDIVAGMSLGVLTLALTMLAWTFLPSALRRRDRPSTRR
ncbi:phosphatase PAP2 family protein [Actinorugispora endophytica]|uniref:Undecaprenyl-diphosphatase n=1 Tax=Actinorugispora endophytica TaxID=1605990 RepID=A0A4R6UFT3_9ACTN|nr:phosphatase PAP2 family protein [Actinorugispora endophytica]TDQ45650.1 undecaprenyl-diphosphatase [Actinorugispora endophytica]